MGIGKDLKQPTNAAPLNQPSQVSKAPSSINIISPDDTEHLVDAKTKSSTLSTRRSQFKKQTPSTIISYSSNSNLHAEQAGQENAAAAEKRSHFETNSKYLIATSFNKVASLMVAPDTKNSIQSQSLTRLNRTIPYRFKSLTAQSSTDSPHAFDDYNPSMSGHNSLTINPSRKNASSTVARTVAATALASASLSASKSNLLSPGHILSKSNSNLNNLNRNCLTVTAPRKEITTSASQQKMQRQMQKLNSKSVDASYLDVNNSEASAAYKHEYSSPNLSRHKLAGGSSQLDSSSSSVNHSPLVPRRNDYEPAHRVTIQRQQQVNEQSPVFTRSANAFKPPPLIQANSINISYYQNNVNTSDSGLSGAEDNNYLLNTSSDIYNYACSEKANNLTLPNKAMHINRPLTLDLKPSFINISKQSEGNYFSFESDGQKIEIYLLRFSMKLFQ